MNRVRRFLLILATVSASSCALAQATATIKTDTYVGTTDTPQQINGQVAVGLPSLFLAADAEVDLIHDNVVIGWSKAHTSGMVSPGRLTAFANAWSLTYAPQNYGLPYIQVGAQTIVLLYESIKVQVAGVGNGVPVDVPYRARLDAGVTSGTTQTTVVHANGQVFFNGSTMPAFSDSIYSDHENLEGATGVIHTQTGAWMRVLMQVSVVASQSFQSPPNHFLFANAPSLLFGVDVPSNFTVTSLSGYDYRRPFGPASSYNRLHID